MPASSELLPSISPPRHESELLELIRNLPGGEEESEPVFRGGIVNEQGLIYRVVAIYSMADVLHFVTAISKLGYSYESGRNDPLPYDGLFQKD
jgi:hypothetical protein